ncbi:MAG: recombinase RecT [Actinobacteria bacterium]|nr:recombinase RecT [Actinomycetota bacterium]MBS1882923.1 recombinase RecT [Actinomycetota bacterium]
MSSIAEAPSRNGDGAKHDVLRYREAVKAKMKKYVVGPGGVSERVRPDEKEVDQFLLECRIYDLEPLVGQIYAVWENGTMHAVATIDGMRLLAERTELYEGQSDPEWCDSEGNWTDYWSGEDTPIAARVRVHRKGTKVPTTGTANWHDFAPLGDAGADSLWNKVGGKPAHMLSIRAEALALRKAFPAQLSGLYTAEELGISLAAIGGEEGGAAAAVAADVPPAPAPPHGAPPVAPAPPAPAPPSAPDGPGAEAPSVIVDAAEGQPSGAPARPATRRTLAQTLADGRYGRQRGELTEALFDQMPDRLTDEQSSVLTTALAEAEQAGITPVELERNCKVALKQGKGNVEVRARALLQWISERHRKADAEAKAEAEGAAALPEAATAEGSRAEEEPGRTPSLLDADPGPEEAP